MATKKTAKRAVRKVVTKAVADPEAAKPRPRPIVRASTSIVRDPKLRPWKVEVYQIEETAIGAEPPKPKKVETFTLNVTGVDGALRAAKKHFSDRGKEFRSVSPAPGNTIITYVYRAPRARPEVRT